MRTTGATTQTIIIWTAGNYSVTITNNFGCSTIKNFAATVYPLPRFDTVLVENDQITIVPLNVGDFEYSIDGLFFQNSPIFSNAPGGLQTASVREINGCGIKTEDFVVLLAPTFFTPNNDGHNDFWTVKGIFAYPNAELRIFDRYGKLLKELRPNSLGWDGNFNGQELPASDYWFVFKMDATAPEKRGHFTLKR